MTPQALAFLAASALAALIATNALCFALAVAYRRESRRHRIERDHMTRIWDSCETECEELRAKELEWRREAHAAWALPGTVPGVSTSGLSSRN
jgi:hypothetical protein